MTTPAEIYQRDWQPKYHLHTPEENQCPYDPNGTIYYNGRWHLFYLFRDEAYGHGMNCWAHLSSPDLITWKRHPLALQCDRPGEVAIISGCALLDRNGIPTLVYASLDFGICIAQSHDENLDHWEKFPENPVIPVVPEDSPEFKVYHVFDPHVWIDETGNYCAILGAQAKPFREFDTCYLFRSSDLIHWDYIRPFYQATDHFCARYDDCACPDFFPVGNGKYALLCLSHAGGARYYIGSLIAGTFVPETHHWLNFPGGNLSAPESCQNPLGRRLAWFWLFTRLEEAKNHPEIKETMSLRELRFSPTKQKLLQFMPAEIDTLCTNRRNWAEALQAKSGTVLPFRSRCGKLELRVTLPQGRLRLQLFSDADGNECIELVIDREQKKIFIDHSRCIFKQKNNPIIYNLGNAPTGLQIPLCLEIPWEPDDRDYYDLDIYMDCSVIELFSRDGEFAASQRIFTSGHCDTMRLAEIPDSATLSGIAFSEMASIDFPPPETKI